VASLSTNATRNVEAFLVLDAVPGLGPRSIFRFWQAYGSGVAAFEAARSLSLEEMAQVAGRRFRPRPGTKRALRNLDLRDARGVVRQAEADGLTMVSLGSPEYPPRLLDLPDPPPVLFVSGSGWPDLTSTVAIVGTRRASAYGRRIASSLGRDFARWGWTVVSGMARGVDAAAHEAALDAGGSTIGVLGSGHGHEYPPSNRRLYARMRESGWLASEFAPRVGPTRRAFPRRNRVIAALSRAVVVVEAGARSGALNTAGHALELGREVLAVPGHVDEGRAAGCLQLLRQGAGVAATVRDVFDALGWVHDDPAPGRGRVRSDEGPGGPDAWLLEALGSGERTADQLATVAGESIRDTLAALGRLELDGRIGRSTGGRFYRRRLASVE